MSETKPPTPATPAPPPDLLSAVRGDLHAVRPLHSPARRALALLPFGLALVVAIPSFWGWRGNLSDMGAAAAWGLSALQALAGMLIVGLALREAVPGRELTRRALGVTALAALVLVAGITLVTSAIAPVTVRPGVWLRWAWECFEVAFVSAVPALAAIGWLASRAMPTRPAVAGAIYGLGAGIIADAGTRLFCWVSTPSHVLVAHGGAIVALAGLGALAATAVDALRNAPRR
jgi:hypothetical protein